MKFAFSTNAYRNLSIEESIRSISSVGYQGIELMCDEPHAFPPLTKDKISSIKNIIQETKMEISNLNGFMMCAIQDFHHPSWIEKNQKYRKKRIEHTKNCIMLAKSLKAKTVSTEPGGPTTGSSRQDELKLFKEGINEVLLVAEENKIKLLIEPEPGLLIENSEQFLDFMIDFDSNYLGLNFDIGHFFCVNEDPAKMIRLLSNHIEHIHLEDIAESRIHKHLIPGTGNINFKEIFQALNDIKYQGFVTTELYPYQQDPVNAATQALNYIKSEFSSD